MNFAFEPLKENELIQNFIYNDKNEYEHIDKKNYNLETVYTNYLLYRKFKKLPVNLIELINLSYMLIPRINDEYILYNTYNKQQLINQINSMNDGHMKMKLLELLTRNTINSKYYYDAVNKNYVLEKPITSDDSDIDLDEDELEHDIAHLNLTDEQRQEMGYKKDDEGDDEPFDSGVFVKKKNPNVIKVKKQGPASRYH